MQRRLLLIVTATVRYAPQTSEYRFVVKVPQVPSLSASEWNECPGMSMSIGAITAHSMNDSTAMTMTDVTG